MAVSIEWIRPDVGIARFGPDHREHGDPYDAAMVIDGQGTEAVYRALIVRHGHRVDAGHWRHLEALLRERGYTRYRRESVSGGHHVRTVTRALR